MIKAAKKRGYVTDGQLNAVIPSEEVTSEQIEDTMAMLSDMGINVVEIEDAGRKTARPKRRPTRPMTTRTNSGGEARDQSKALTTTEKKEPTERTDDPCACICAKWARSNCCRAKAKSRSPSASKPAANMIAGLCESPLTIQAFIIWRDELDDGKVSCATSSTSKPPMPVPTAEDAVPVTVGPDGKPVPQAVARPFPARRIEGREAGRAASREPQKTPIKQAENAADGEETRIRQKG